MVMMWARPVGIIIRARCQARGSRAMGEMVSSPMELRFSLGMTPVSSSGLMVSVFSM